MSSQFAEWVEIAEQTGGHLDFSIYDILKDWREDRAQRDAEHDDLLALVAAMQVAPIKTAAHRWDTIHPTRENPWRAVLIALAHVQGE